MDEYEATKWLLRDLSDTSLRTLHDAIRQANVDAATPDLALNRLLANVARVLAERS